LNYDTIIFSFIFLVLIVLRMTYKEIIFNSSHVFIGTSSSDNILRENKDDSRPLVDFQNFPFFT
jgi:hypothetical protein